MGAPWELFTIIASVLMAGGSFCYYMSQKQKKAFEEEAANRTIIVMLPMYSMPTSDTLPVYSAAAATT
ncbi:hypothetical protein BGX23_000307, partial [Mortierella sp. AD031]